MNKEDLKKEFEKKWVNGEILIRERSCLEDDAYDIADWWLDKIDRAKEEGFVLAQDTSQANFRHWKIVFRSELIGEIERIEEFDETYCKEDETLFLAIKKQIINLIKEYGR